MDSHRRQTLGAFSPNAMPNRRMSMAPNRVAKGGMNKARQSMAPSSAAPARPEPGRQANVRRSGHGKGPADPRPIADKAWQLTCMKEVMQYVCVRGYDKDIDLKRLTSPRKADWEHLIKFMMQQVDPLWQQSPAGPNGKQALEPDIEAFLKWTGYQHVPGKSALFTPGNASTWPQLLGVLRFLEKYMVYRESVDALDKEVDEFGNRKRPHAWEASDMKKFAVFVEQTYERYMAVDDEEDARITAQFGAEVTTENAKLQNGNAATAAENEALQAQLEEMRAAPAPLAAAQATRDEAAADRTNWQRHIEAFQAKREAQRRKEAAWRAQVATLRERVDHAQNDNAELRCHVAEQPYTAEEAARMNADKIKEGEQLSAAQAQVAGLEQAVAQAQAGLAKRFEALDAAAQGFNRAAERLGLLNGAGAPGKRARGVAYEARVDRTAAAAADFVSADLKGAVRAGLEVLRGDYQRTETELTARRFAADETLAALTDGNRERGEDSACLNLEVNRLQKAYAEAAAAAEQGVKALQGEAATLAAQAAELRGVTSDGVALSKQALLQKESELEILQKQCLEERVQLGRELGHALNVLAQYQVWVQRQLKRTRSTMESLQDKTESRIKMSACAA